MTHIQREIDWQGDAYHRLSDLQYGHGMELVDLLDLRGDELLLDAGCGSGRITRDLLVRLPRGGIIGVDLSKRMLDTAREEVQPASGQRVEFICADLQEFKLTEQVDGIFSNMALHFIGDQGRLFRNFADMLKPNGFLALQFGSKHILKAGSMNVMEMLKQPPYSEYISAKVFGYVGGDEHETRGFLESAGFTDISVEDVPARMPADQLAKMQDFMRQTLIVDCLDALPEELRGEFKTKAEAAVSTTFDDAFHYLRVRAQAGAGH